MKRRHFLVSSTASLGLASAPIPNLAFYSSPLSTDLPIYAIADDVLPRSNEFVELCHSGQVSVHSFKSGITSLWAKTLAPMMNRSAPIIVGSTSETCLHCLVPLAAGMGYFLASEKKYSATFNGQALSSVSWVLKPTRKTILNLTA